MPGKRGAKTGGNWARTRPCPGLPSEVMTRRPAAHRRYRWRLLPPGPDL